MRRLSVALDAACGLSHLHHSSPKVFHRDIKSPNILMDRNGTGKMADFGLSCLSHGSSHKVKQAAGTVGYACPLYVHRGVVTEGSEVYSFGIVLLELLTAAPPAYVTQGPDGNQQYNFLVTHIAGSAATAASMADPKAQWSPMLQSSIAELAMRCIDMPEEVRPGFAEVVNTLRKLRDTPEPPAPPAPPAPPLPAPQAVLPGVSAAGHGVGVGHYYDPSAVVGATGMSPHMGVSPQTRYTSPRHRVPSPQMRVQAPVRAPSPQMRAWAADATPQARVRVPSPQQVVRRQMIVQQPVQQNAPQQQPVVSQITSVVWGQGGTALPQPQPVAQYYAHVPPPNIVARTSAPATPVLWMLECLPGPGNGAAALSQAQTRLVHRHEPGGPLLTTLRVGRLFQETFFYTLIPDEDARGAVSREHFQIWADEMSAPYAGSPPQGGIPCYFFPDQLQCEWHVCQW
jgi:hypothetical protein